MYLGYIILLLGSQFYRANKLRKADEKTLNRYNYKFILNRNSVFHIS